MEDTLVAPPRPIFLVGGLRENYTLIRIPPELPTYRRFELEMYFLLRRFPNPPATLESIESLEVVIVSEEEAKEGKRCTICLDKWKNGDVAKELPCHHRYHGMCIRDWLRSCGMCPVCKYPMPMDFESVIKKQRWLRENRRENLARFLILNGSLKNRVVYADEETVSLGEQVGRLRDN